jgi:hypothetical protein
LAASKEAVNKAEQSVEKRFDSVDEFRQTLADMTARLIQRTEVDVVTKALGDKIDTVSSRMDRVQGAINGSGSTISYILAGLAVLIAGASGIIAFVSYNHAPSRDADQVRNFYLTPPPSGQIVPGPSRQ